MDTIWAVYEVMEDGELVLKQTGSWKEIEDGNWLGMEYGVCTLTAWENRLNG